MKNEVKKKMMIESRKLWHESHDERIFVTKVNSNFSEMRGCFSKSRPETRFVMR